ncbi:hypothetical protein AB8A31_15800 [Tardiphaga sp. 804_B3_N1_9]|uniref:hypothetical protein n=1 Tax=Tardiphaga sp. 804_B3_N1_9 TaxID=3240786 RepID=UPI003F1E91B0
MTDLPPYDTQEQELQILAWVDALPDDAYERVRVCLEKRPSKRKRGRPENPEQIQRRTVYTMYAVKRIRLVKDWNLNESIEESAELVGRHLGFDMSSGTAETIALVNIARGNNRPYFKAARLMWERKDNDERDAISKEVAALTPEINRNQLSLA